tara:strand:- start:122 stop:328 length:207 start_codon:yes stop_codon:yes gene_type:complete
MDIKDIKEANRLFWMVKGMLIPDHFDEKDIKWVLDSYTRRVWYNHEVNDEGFDDAWREKQVSKAQRIY